MWPVFLLRRTCQTGDPGSRIGIFRRWSRGGEFGDA